MLKDYRSFQQGGFVSVWIGDLSDEELDDYLNMSENFSKDFGFRLNEKDAPEATSEPEGASIAQLVDRFSWSKSYREAVIATAVGQGIHQSRAMVVFHNFRYDPAKVSVGRVAKLVFLGAFPFS
jgi:hypothetical protein